MIALLVFSVSVSTILPIIVTVQQERQSIHQERLGEEVLHYYYYKFFYNNEVLPEEVNRGETSFQLNLLEETKESLLCVAWQGRNGRDYERCLSSRKNM